MSNFSSNNYNPFKKVNSNQNNIENSNVEINKTNIKNKVPLQLKMNKNIIQDDNTDNNFDYGNDYEEMQKIASICNKEISFDDL